MTRPKPGLTHGDEVWSIDDLELELRKLPGVRAAGFDDCDDLLLVQLHITDDAERASHADRNDQPVPVAASRIAARHSDRPVAVEVVRWRSAPIIAPPIVSEVPVAEPMVDLSAAEAAPATEPITPEVSRPRLLAVLAFPETDELEVHLVLDGKRTIGRAAASRGTEGAVAATIEAVRELGLQLQPRIRWAHELEDVDAGDQIVVAVALDDIDTRAPSQYGMAAGSSVIDAAARATLDALNRHLTRQL